ncbi:unnamed protein product [Mytilus coruscus]|uniref:Uncharacterized protein n=1 Tax=Mytilus coruscus TaxID=42192 RepID=A0A6J8EM83_MYTCO|nr:unnamed protein product [Mytilus coruscus]
MTTFLCKEEGDQHFLNKILASKHLGLKPLCNVMLILNLSDTLVNGLIGTVRKINSDSVDVEFAVDDLSCCHVQFDSGVDDKSDSCKSDSHRDKNDSECDTNEIIGGLIINDKDSLFSDNDEALVTCKETHQLRTLPEEISPAGRGKIRYVGRYVIAKLKYNAYKSLRNKLFNENKVQEIKILKTEIKLFENKSTSHFRLKSELVTQESIFKDSTFTKAQLQTLEKAYGVTLLSKLKKEDMAKELNSAINQAQCVQFPNELIISSTPVGSSSEPIPSTSNLTYESSESNVEDITNKRSFKTYQQWKRNTSKLKSSIISFDIRFS